MSRVSLALALALAAAAPAAAGTMLYATAATTGGVTGYCLGPNGAINPDPIVNVQTHGNSPSRLITSPDGRFLYVAENDQTEVWSIGPKGSLTRAGSIPDTPLRASTPTTSPSGCRRMAARTCSTYPSAGRTAWPPSRSIPRPGSRPRPLGDGTTCVRDTAPAGWENLIVANGLVYSTR